LVHFALVWQAKIVIPQGVSAGLLAWWTHDCSHGEVLREVSRGPPQQKTEGGLGV
jgi:hypothetical protein